MSDSTTIRKLKDSIQRRGERSSHEQIEEMVNDHVIDREGKVLLRRPETSPWATANGVETSGNDSPVSATSPKAGS